MATGFRRDIHLRQDKILSENISRGGKDLKSGITAPRRPVLNDLSSNLQLTQNANQKGKIGISKPSTRLAANLNHTTTTTTTSKVNSTKAVVKVSSTLKENVSNIPKAISKPRPANIVRPFRGTLTRSSSLRSKSINSLSEVQKKEQEWLAACKVDAVDKSDEFDPFLVGIYSKSIFEYLLTLEDKYMISPNYLANHKSITPSNRSVVVDWLVEVQQEFQLMQESLYTAVGILDRYLQDNVDLPRNKLQLIGATSLLLGCKYEEIYVPEINDFVYLSDNAFTKEEVKSSLVDVFRVLKYSLSKPFSLTFLRRFSKVSGARSSQHSLAKYFLELSLVDYNLVHIKPSEMAAAGLLLAIVITNDPQLEDEPEDVYSLLSLHWTEILRKHSTYKINDIIPTVQALAKLALNAPEWKYKAVYKKYQSAKMGRITSSSLLCSPAMRFIAQIS